MSDPTNPVPATSAVLDHPPQAHAPAGVDAIRRPFWGPVLTFGFGTSVAMWCVWFVTHLPAVSVPSSISGPLILATVIAGMALCGRALGPFGRGHAVRVAVAAGLLAALLNLLLLGSKIVEQPPQAALEGELPTAPAPGADGLRPSAPIMVAGFLALGGLSGLLGGGVGALTRSHGRRIHDWLWRFTLVTAAAFLPLLLVGGLVTSTRSGMAVPDWPGSYGANMFLYPISLMSHPQIFLEHSHRLFGSLVGLTSLACMLYTLAAGGQDRAPLGARRLGVIVFVLVVGQGILGGLRVTENNQVLAMLHGISAQIVFALACWQAALVLPALRNVDANAMPDKLARIAATGTAHAYVLQLAFGAAYRHLHQPHALWSHVGFSFVVLVLGILAGAAAQKRTNDANDQIPARRLSRRLGLAMVVVISVQFLLGWATLGVMGMPSKKPDIPTAERLAEAEAVPPGQALVRTIHQANGAVLFGVATFLSVTSQRLNRRRG